VLLSRNLLFDIRYHQDLNSIGMLTLPELEVIVKVYIVYLSLFNCILDTDLVLEPGSVKSRCVTLTDSLYILQACGGESGDQDLLNGMFIEVKAHRPRLVLEWVTTREAVNLGPLVGMVLNL